MHSYSNIIAGTAVVFLILCIIQIILVLTKAADPSYQIYIYGGIAIMAGLSRLGMFLLNRKRMAHRE